MQSTAGHPRAPGRSRTAFANSNGRKPGLSVDLSANGSQSSSVDAQSVMGGSGRASPVTSGLESPNRLGGSQRGGMRQASSNGASSPRVLGNERAPVAFPPRPGQYTSEVEVKIHDRPGCQPNWPKPEFKAHSFDAPAAAQIYPQNKSTDFHPWMGDHVEDSLTEQTVKSGLINKPTNGNETNTARPSIWNHIKGNKGIANLSNLFVAILDKRQTMLRLSGPSTFKPPPRVTLTNTKREAWLRDLANPAFALRRLNRTIPYGINGKVLLEQCLNKDIPTARAVWLAKCIGANELRTLKRKGVTGAPGISGELKWVREWTVHVEQFVESVIANSGEEAWKDKMHYVMRLVFHLFVEQLLDHEHFLEWILSTFESSTVERLPMWLVHIQLYWKYIVSSRKRGRRLAELLLRHLGVISTGQDSDLLSPVLHRMQLLVATLAVSHGGCLIIPKVWEQYGEQLRCLSTKPEFANGQSAINSIVMRNERLARSAKHRVQSFTSSPRRRVFGLLDGSTPTIQLNKLTAECLAEFDTPEDLVPVVLQWASSLHREGIHRIYVAARILRRCKILGADIESVIIAYITSLPETPRIDVNIIWRIVAELVRSRQFAVAHLLQSMIATGRISSTEHDALSTGRLIQLIQNIPIHDVPQHIADLRRILLDTAGVRITDEAEDIQTLQKLIASRMRESSASSGPDQNEYLKRLDTLTLSGKLMMTVWLRQEVLILTSAGLHQSREDNDLEQLPDYTSCSNIFLVARNVLECLEDIAILADVIGICSTTSDMEAMASLVDTLHFHHQCFAAIGALQPLLKQTLERYQILRNEAPLEQVYVRALADLCSTCSVDEGLQQQLSYDLSRCEQRNVLAMCSPASDNAADMLTSNSMDSDDDIERVFASGTTMDEQSMARTFARLTGRLEEQTSDSSSKSLLCGQWFARLRSFDENNFDELMRQWLSSATFTSNPSVYAQVLPALVGSETLTVSGFVQMTGEYIQSLDSTNTGTKAVLTLGMLEALLSTTVLDSFATPFEIYKYRLEKRKFAMENSSEILHHIHRIIALASVVPRLPSHDAIRKLLFNRNSLAFLKHVTLQTQQSLLGESHSDMTATLGASGLLKSLVDKLLDPKDNLNLSSLPQRDQLALLVRIADDLSLPFCQLEVQQLLYVGSAAQASNVDLSSALFDAIMLTGEDGQLAWLDLIDGLDSDVLLKIRQSAESQILATVSDCISSLRVSGQAVAIERVRTDQLALRKFLSILGSTNAAATGSFSPEDALAVNDRLRAVADLLLSFNEDDTHFDDTTNVLAVIAACHCIDALLQLTVNIINPLDATKTQLGETSSAILRTLCALLTEPRLASHGPIIEFIYDITLYLSDDLTDDLRSQFLKTESQRHSDDPRVSFLFGPLPFTDGWINLVTTNNSTPPHVPISRPNTPQAPVGRPPVRPPVPQRQASNLQNQPKNYNPPVPFPLRRWELLPDQGNNASGNDTAISLALFGARKVDSQL